MPPTISPMASECSRLTMKPTDRSNWLAEMTVISASARNATIDLSDRIDWASSAAEGKVRGSRTENSTISATVSSSSAWLATSLNAVPRDSAMGQFLNG